VRALRTLLVVLVVALFGAVAAGALDVDWGGSIDNASTPAVTLDPAGTLYAWDQRNRAALWVDMHFNPAFSLAVQGSYALLPSFPYVFDIDYLRADWQVLPFLKTTAGRFIFSDFTGHVLNHKLDGLMFTSAFPFGVFTASVGFSGLVLKPSSLILMSRTDSADQSNTGVYFAAPRLIEKVDALIPNILPRQDLALVAILQQDLRAQSGLIQPGETQINPPGLSGGSLSSQYWGVGLSGAIVSGFYYNAYFYLNTGSTLSYLTSSGSWQYANILAYLGGVGLRYFNEGALGSRVELEAIYSSGDADNTSYQEGNTAGDSSIFVPISQDTLGIAFQPQWGNLLLINANYSLKPFSRSATVWQDLQLMFKALGYLRPTTGAISQVGLNPGSTDLYLGTELQLILNFRPLSDLGTALSFGYFLPNSSAFAGSAAQPVLAGRLEVSFSF
jgi:hypothetical protein